jgi:hypothetical protein
MINYLEVDVKHQSLVIGNDDVIGTGQVGWVNYRRPQALQGLQCSFKCGDDAVILA